MTTENTWEVGQAVKHEGEKWVVDHIAKGWFTIKQNDNAAKKVRAKDLEEWEDKPVGMAATLDRYKPGYVEAVAYSGAKSLDNGDTLAELLRGATPLEVCNAADIIKEEEAGYHATRYAGLNPGQRRMNSGNRIRAAWKAGECTVEDVRNALAAQRVTENTEAA